MSGEDESGKLVPAVSPEEPEPVPVAVTVQEEKPKDEVKKDVTIVEDNSSKPQQRRNKRNRKTQDELIQMLREDKNRTLEVDEVAHLIEEEFPESEKWPKDYEMDAAVLEDNGKLPFRTGQWVERMGNDMLWHLEPIRRTSQAVSARAGKAYDTWYKTSSGLMFPMEHVRAPKEGLVRQFGMRPFLWQQWAFLRTEQYVRFQLNHERDFEIVDFLKTAEFLFDEWLLDARNKDFKEVYDSKPEGAQQKLKSHLFKPFELMKEMCQDEEKWDMWDSNASVYQYTSFLGSGFGTSFVVIFIQLAVPFLLLMFSVRETPRFPAYLSGNVSSLDIAGLFNTDFDTFCNQFVALDAIMMNVVIFVVYSIRVVPAVIDSFYSTVGDKDSINSRMNSVRLICWLQGDDTLFMQLGFKMDRYMNSVYIAVINLLMLFTLFLTDSTVDVILNALAIEFVYNFDREVPNSVWYDPSRRYLKAGIVEVVIRGELLLEPMIFTSLFCSTYDVDEEEYNAKVGGPLKDRSLANRDVEDPQYMTPKDKLWIASAHAAEELGKEEAIWQFREHKVYFGVFDWIFRPRHGVFHRYSDYFSWSRWDAALFLPKVPEADSISQYKGLASLSMGMSQASFRGSGGESDNGHSNSKSSLFSSFRSGGNRKKFMNFDPSSHLDARSRFWKDVSDVFKCESLKASVATAYRRKNYHQLPFRFLDGCFEWVSFVFIVFIFPSCLGGYAYLILGCQPLV